MRTKKGFLFLEKIFEAYLKCLKDIDFLFISQKSEKRLNNWNKNFFVEQISKRNFEKGFPALEI